MKKLIYILLSVLVVLPAEMDGQAQIIIEGTVSDGSTGEVLPGVSVIIKGTPHGTITDIDGHYSLESGLEAFTLVFTYIGYLQEEVSVTGSARVDVSMTEDIVSLDEVVVIGYSVMKKRKLTGAVSRVFESGEKAGFSEALSGRTPGVSVVESAMDGYSDDAGMQQSVRAGILTAGEINDFGKWELWNDISGSQLNNHAKQWGILPQHRYSVMFQTKEGYAIPNAKVRLLQGTTVIWQGRTDNTGTAELWAGYHESDSLKQKSFSIEVEYNGMVYPLAEARPFHKGLNMITAGESCVSRNVIDIAFVVDATGSMGDEINYLKAELDDIMRSLKDTLPDNQINLGCLVYRDHGDDYVTKMTDLSSDYSKSIQFVRENYAGGGGDGPEAVEEALEVVINGMSWDENAISKVIFLILDAPPHDNSQVKEKLDQAIESAAKKGIRIVPVTCSGIDKSTEYLMRSLALLTNGTYVFLTDDSGVGGSHIKPTTDEYEVELFNDLVQRLIVQYSSVVDCMAKAPEIRQDTVMIRVKQAVELLDTLTAEVVEPDETEVEENITSLQPSWKCYPNPTTGLITIESDMEINTVYLCDITGKIVKRHFGNGTFRTTLDISDYRRGVYFISYEYDTDRWMRGKIILTR
ncbi:MAG: carboxypeptidase-like regulatory domain-containing protein [Bacteroidales bacterium]|nr:carboxypeptidase-like regulatory domain-containing protein [Bacteroidales bacterium]